MFDRLYKVSWKIYKDLCYFFVEMNKLKIFKSRIEKRLYQILKIRIYLPVLYHLVIAPLHKR